MNYLTIALYFVLSMTLSGLNLSLPAAYALLMASMKIEETLLDQEND